MGRTPLKRVLVVDDEPDVRSLVQVALESLAGIAVTVAVNGRDALEQAGNWRPDLILLDASMPVMDGPATLRELRNTPVTEKIPVVFLTARSSETEKAALLATGARAVITKPFNPMSLPQQVVRIWEQLAEVDGASPDQS